MAPPLPSTRRWPTTYSAGGLVCSVDHLASSAGAEVLAAGGSAADAAVAASAVLAVTTPHMCGMGGDLFAVVHDGSGPPEVLDAAGRAGSGADPDRMRAEGLTEIPFRGDVRAATVPGCVDGWAALVERHGRLSLAEDLAPARRLAENGFPASPLLAFMLGDLDGVEGCDELATVRPDVGRRVVRPDLARVLAAVSDRGRVGFYQGEFGAALVRVGAGEFAEEDLARPGCRWVDALGARVWGHDLWTVPPVSQGYLTLAGAGIAERIAGAALGSPEDPAWAHLLVEASRLAGEDRPAVLHDDADGPALLAAGRLAAAAARFDPSRPSGAAGPTRDGGTIHLAAVDAAGMGVSLIQSNAADFGCRVAVPGTGILLHNRGIGFSLEGSPSRVPARSAAAPHPRARRGHPAGRQPPVRARHHGRRLPAPGGAPAARPPPPRRRGPRRRPRRTPLRAGHRLAPELRHLAGAPAGGQGRGPRPDRLGHRAGGPGPPRGGGGVRPRRLRPRPRDRGAAPTASGPVPPTCGP